MNAGRVVLIVSSVAVAALGIGFVLVSWDAANKMAAVVSALAAVAAVGVSVWAVVRPPPSPTPTAVEKRSRRQLTVNFLGRELFWLTLD